MFQLEDSDVELCDEIYELYTDLLQETEEEEDSLCYKSYFLVRGKTHIYEKHWLSLSPFILLSRSPSCMYFRWFFPWRLRMVGNLLHIILLANYRLNFIFLFSTITFDKIGALVRKWDLFIHVALKKLCNGSLLICLKKYNLCVF